MSSRDDPVPRNSHRRAGEPLALLRIEHEETIESLVEGAEQPADQVPFVTVEAERTVGELEPIRVQVEECWHREGLLEIEREEAHHELRRTDHAIITAAPKDLLQLHQVRNAEHLRLVLRNTELRDGWNHRQVRRRRA